MATKKFVRCTEVLTATLFDGDIGDPDIVAFDLPSEHRAGEDCLRLVDDDTGDVTYVESGDWILTDDGGVIGVVDSPIFEKSYEEVTP